MHHDEYLICFRVDLSFTSRGGMARHILRVTVHTAQVFKPDKYDSSLSVWLYNLLCGYFVFNGSVTLSGTYPKRLTPAISYVLLI